MCMQAGSRRKHADLFRSSASRLPKNGASAVTINPSYPDRSASVLRQLKVRTNTRMSAQYASYRHLTIRFNTRTSVQHESYIQTSQTLHVKWCQLNQTLKRAGACLQRGGSSRCTSRFTKSRSLKTYSWKNMRAPPAPAWRTSARGTVPMVDWTCPFQNQAAQSCFD